MATRQRVAMLIEVLGFLTIVGYARSSCFPTPPGQIPAARGIIVDFSGQPLAGARIQIFAAQPHGRRNLPLFCVQYHPEASPGPHDSHYLFKDFVKMMEEFER